MNRVYININDLLHLLSTKNKESYNMQDIVRAANSSSYLAYDSCSDKLLDIEDYKIVFDNEKGYTLVKVDY